MSSTDAKIPLPQFLKIMTNGEVPMAKAMSAAGKIYKQYSTPGQLALLTEADLKLLGVDNTADRKLILSAFRKAGYRASVKRRTSEETIPASPSKRKRESELTPDDPYVENIGPGDLEFNEVVDEHVLALKRTIINRAPVMAAWATVVAERLNFTRKEALSIASVYTEMNAVSKGVSLGIYDKKEPEATSSTQPYVELMGRRVPVYRTRDEQWRGLANGSPVSPMTAFGYISRSFRQNMAYVIGAMRLLAESYTPSELSEKAWSLYTQFRPELDQWGKRSELSCSKILSLRKSPEET